MMIVLWGGNDERRAATRWLSFLGAAVCAAPCPCSVGCNCAWGLLDGGGGCCVLWVVLFWIIIMGSVLYCWFYCVGVFCCVTRISFVRRDESDILDK